MVSSSECRSARHKPEVMVLDAQELDAIVLRAQAAGLSAEDCKKLQALVDTVAWLHQELDENNLTVARLRSLFGLRSSEKTAAVLGDKPQAHARTEPEPEGAATQPKPSPKGHGRNGALDYTGAERIPVGHGRLEAKAPCPACPKHKQGKLYLLREPRRLVRVVGQAPLRATVYELETLRCNLCGAVFTADPPAGVGNVKYDATSASMIALLKYGSGLPFNRLERLEGNLGIPLPAATQWEIVQEAAQEVQPAFQELLRQAAQGRLLHNDDTSVQVLDLRREIDRSLASGEAESERTGIFTTSIVSELETGQRIALYFTGRKHAGENIEDLLRQRSAELGPPLQMCDGLDRNLPKEFATILANCLVHGRRKFVEVAASFPQECRFVLETLRDVYKHDATARERRLNDAERLLYHQEHSGPLMDKLKTWLKEQIDEKRVEPNSSLGKAISYMRKRWEKLTLFLHVPGAPLDNNAAERALKKAILHRKNALFYKTENGARVGDIFMSLIHTAELAGANAFDYLTALLQHTSEVRRDPRQWLPWTYTSARSAGDEGP